MWARWLNLVLGVWLFIAPMVLDYAERAARLNDAAVGLCVAIVSMIAASIPALRFINTALGVWLLLAPLLLGYGDSTAPTANDLILGVFIIAVSLVPAQRPAMRGLRRAYPAR